MKRKEYEIEICYKCNWNCEYCCVKTHTKKPKNDNEIIKNFLSYGIKDSDITISGGEPSFASDYILQFIIDYSIENNCEINLNTNGRFFTHKSELVKYFKEINYHCSEDLQPIKIKEYLVPNSVNVNYLIIVTDNNRKRLQKFIDINQEFFIYNKLLIIPASNPYGVDGPTLSLSNYKELFINFKNYMTDESKLRFITNNKSFQESKITYITSELSNEI